MSGPEMSRVVLGLEGAEDQRFSEKLALGRGCGGWGGDCDFLRTLHTQTEAASGELDAGWL